MDKKPSHSAQTPVVPSRDEFTEFRNPNDPTLDRLVAAIDRAYHHPWAMLWRSLCQGVMTGIGITLGTIFVSAILVFIFNRMGGVELLRKPLQSVQEMIFPAEFR